MTDVRYAPPTQAELEEMFAEPTPADSLNECAHSGACMRIWELCNGCEVNTEAFGWMDECAAALGCADCEEWERA